MTVLIPKNSTIPTKKVQVFTTSFDNQTSMCIEVFECERQMTKACNLLGELNLEEIWPAPKGVPQIVVAFEIDGNGILNVSTQEKGTEKSNQVIITNGKERFSKNDIESMIAEADRFKKQDEVVRKKIEAKNGLESYAYN